MELEKYNNHRKIGTFQRSLAHYSIRYYTNDFPEFWLIDRVKYSKKTGEIVEDVFILLKDLYVDIEFWGKKGYSGRIRRRFTINGKYKTIIPSQKKIRKKYGGKY